MACRLLMPMEMAKRLIRTLADTVSKVGQPTGMMPEIVTRPN